MGLVIFGAESRLDTDSVAVTPAEASGFPASNLSDDRLFTHFKPGTAATTVDVVTDAGVGNTVTADYFMAAAHDLFDPGSDGGGAPLLTFAQSADGIAFTTIFTDTRTADKIVARVFTAVTNRFFRLRMTRGTSFIPSIGQLQWGRRVEATDPTLRVGFDPNRERLVRRFNRGVTGNIIGSVHQYTERQMEANLRFQANSWVTGGSISDFTEFWDNHVSLGKPFLFWWNPNDQTTPSTPGSFETDAFFGVLAADGTVERPLATPLDSGFRHVRMQVIGLKERPIV